MYSSYNSTGVATTVFSALFLFYMLLRVAVHLRKTCTPFIPSTLSVLKDYSIIQKLGAIVGDNASTNNTLCTIVEKYLLKEEEIK